MPDPIETAHQNVERLRTWAALRVRKSERRGINRLVDAYLREMSALRGRRKTSKAK